MKKLLTKIICEWIIWASGLISEEVIVNNLKKTATSNVAEGTKDDFLGGGEQRR
jgi:hypothetical protein